MSAGPIAPPPPKRGRGRPRKAPRDNSGPSAPPLQNAQGPPAPPAVDATISSHPTAYTEDAPDWLLKPGIIEEQAGEATSKGQADAATALLSFVSYGFGMAAKKTGWEGWNLEPEEKEQWLTLLTFAAKYIPVKNLPIIAATIMVAMITAGKFMNFAEWKKNNSGISSANAPAPGSAAGKQTQVPL